VTPCSVVVGYRRFGEPCCLYLNPGDHYLSEIKYSQICCCKLLEILCRMHGVYQLVSMLRFYFLFPLNVLRRAYN
jgi:hypothetical protein